MTTTEDTSITNVENTDEYNEWGDLYHSNILEWSDDDDGFDILGTASSVEAGIELDAADVFSESSNHQGRAPVETGRTRQEISNSSDWCCVERTAKASVACISAFGHDHAHNTTVFASTARHAGNLDDAVAPLIDKGGDIGVDLPQRAPTVFTRDDGECWNDESTTPDGIENDMDQKPAAVRGFGHAFLPATHHVRFDESTRCTENDMDQKPAAARGFGHASPPGFQQESIDQTPMTFTKDDIKQKRDALFFANYRHLNKPYKQWRDLVEKYSSNNQGWTDAIGKKIYDDLTTAGVKKFFVRMEADQNEDEKAGTSPTSSNNSNVATKKKGKSKKGLWKEVGYEELLRRTKERFNDDRKTQVAPVAKKPKRKTKRSASQATTTGAEAAQPAGGEEVARPPESDSLRIREIWSAPPEKGVCFDHNLHPGFAVWKLVVNDISNAFPEWNDVIVDRVIRTLVGRGYLNLFLVFQTEDDRPTTSINDGRWVKAWEEEILDKTRKEYESHRMAISNTQGSSAGQSPPPSGGGGQDESRHEQNYMGPGSKDSTGGGGPASGATLPDSTSHGSSGGGGQQGQFNGTCHSNHCQMDVDSYGVSSSEDEMEDDDSDEEHSDVSDDDTTESEDDESDGDDDDDDAGDPSSKQDNKVAATQRSPHVARQIQLCTAAYREKHALSSSASDSSCSSDGSLDSKNTFTSQKRRRLVAGRYATDVVPHMDLNHSERFAEEARNSGEQTKILESTLSDELAQIQVNDHPLAVSYPKKGKPKKQVSVVNKLVFTEIGIDQTLTAVRGVGNAYLPVTHHGRFGESTTPGNTEIGMEQQPGAVRGVANADLPVAHRALFGESTTPSTKNGMDRTLSATGGVGIAYVPMEPSSSLDATTKRIFVSSSSPDATSKRIFVIPTKDDVLRGHGRSAGNRRLREFIRPLSNTYTGFKTRGEKAHLSESVVDEVHSWGGRFLEMDCDGFGNKRYYEMNHQAAVKLVEQRMRDGLSPKRAANPFKVNE